MKTSSLFSDSAGDDNVKEAKRRLCQVTSNGTEEFLENGTRWRAFTERTRNEIQKLLAPKDVLQFAQTRINFEHRGNIHHEGKFTALYERELLTSFPHFSKYLNEFSDIPDSAEDTTYVHNGRLVSNVMFYLARIVMSCLTYLPAYPKTVLEVGGGYGAPGRMWMSNPIHNPVTYIILDIPESLFFADVFLRNQFGNQSVYYVSQSDGQVIEAIGSHKFILCPLPYMAALENLEIDLVINTGSLQEMSEEWVDYYANWLDQPNFRYFYSLNYFAQPIDRLWESGNLYSPRLSSNWKALLLRLNPAFVRMQADRDYLEAIYERKACALSLTKARELFSVLDDRAPSGEIWVEMMDIVRRSNGTVILLDALRYSTRLAVPPKESLWLANVLLERDISPSEKSEVMSRREMLTKLRTSGIEAFYS